MDCKYPNCELKGYAFDLEPRTGKPITCFVNCPTMRKHELTAEGIENVTPNRDFCFHAVDPLVDRGCVLLDGQCKCGDPFNKCEKYFRESSMNDGGL